MASGRPTAGVSVHRGPGSATNAASGPPARITSSSAPSPSAMMTMSTAAGQQKQKQKTKQKTREQTTQKTNTVTKRDVMMGGKFNRKAPATMPTDLDGFSPRVVSSACKRLRIPAKATATVTSWAEGRAVVGSNSYLVYLSYLPQGRFERGLRGVDALTVVG